MSAEPGSVRVSVLVPTKNGGALLRRVVSMVLDQAFPLRTELLLVDSGSPDAELEELRLLGARVRRIAPQDFDHGETRDLLAESSRGEVLVFLNQDALPSSRRWLADLVAPFESDPSLAAVQGGIREFDEDGLGDGARRRFFWHSCGPRFHFTSESRAWIDAHGGLGFSTVNCAIARWAWEEERFGKAAILEDKRWQERAAERGWRITERPDAFVWHTHDFDTVGLARRCAAEGSGWRAIGVRYRFRDALFDLSTSELWREWRRGVRCGELSRPAELLFPVLRPLAVWWGNGRSWSGENS